MLHTEGETAVWMIHIIHQKKEDSWASSEGWMHLKAEYMHSGCLPCNKLLNWTFQRIKRVTDKRQCLSLAWAQPSMKAQDLIFTSRNCYFQKCFLFSLTQCHRYVIADLIIWCYDKLFWKHHLSRSKIKPSLCHHIICWSYQYITQQVHSCVVQTAHISSMCLENHSQK